MNAPFPVDVAVIGAGFMGRVHARVVRSLPYARVVAVVDVDEDRARELAREVGATAYRDAEEAFERERPRAAVVATPEHLHRAAVEAAARHGAAVLVEKPLSTTLEDGAAMIEACRRAGVPLMVGYILRFEPAYVALKQAVDAGSLGSLVSVYARRNAPVQEGERLGGRTHPVDYLAVHDIDQILWYHPARVRTVMARQAWGPLGRRQGVPDMTWVWMEFEDGLVAVVESGWSLPRRWAGWSGPAPWAGFGDVRMDLVGSEGMASLDFRPMNVMAVDQDGWKWPDTRHWPWMHGAPGRAVRAEVEHFLRCTLDATAPIVDGEQAQRVTEVALAARRSLREGREVAL